MFIWLVQQFPTVGIAERIQYFPITESQLLVARIELQRRAEAGDSMARQILQTYTRSGKKLSDWKGGKERLLGAKKGMGPLLMALLGAGFWTDHEDDRQRSVARRGSSTSVGSVPAATPTTAATAAAAPTAPATAGAAAKKK